jgi:transposase InsO family protein
VYPIRRKADVLAAFKTFKARVELEYEKKIKCLRTDNEGEYTSDEFDNFCQYEGIKRQFTTTYTPRQNGVLRADEQNSIRKNKSNVEGCRSRKVILGRSSQYRLLCDKSICVNWN